MKFSTEDFFSKCEQVRSFLRIWSHLLKKSLIENFIFCAVFIALEHLTLFTEVMGQDDLYLNFPAMVFLIAVFIFRDIEPGSFGIFLTILLV